MAIDTLLKDALAFRRLYAAIVSIRFIYFIIITYNNLKNNVS